MKEAHDLALQIGQDAEDQRRLSYEAEARFERRQAFSEYGEAALIMMIDKGIADPEMADDGALSCEEFLAEYGVEKRDVNWALLRLQMAIDKGDFKLRNDIYDFFTEILS